MIAVALFYLMIGHTDFILKRLGYSRNEISKSIYKIMRIVGWIMLAGSIGNLFYESIYWSIGYIAIAFFALKIIRLSNEYFEKTE